MSNIYKYEENDIRYFDRHTGEEIVICKVCSSDVYKSCATKNVCGKCIEHYKFVSSILNN